MAASGFPEDKYEIVTNFPRRILTAKKEDETKTLKELSLHPRETVFVQLIDWPNFRKLIYPQWIFPLLKMIERDLERSNHKYLPIYQSIIFPDLIFFYVSAQTDDTLFDKWNKRHNKTLTGPSFCLFLLKGFEKTSIKSCVSRISMIKLFRNIGLANHATSHKAHGNFLSKYGSAFLYCLAWIVAFSSENESEWRDCPRGHRELSKQKRKENTKLGTQLFSRPEITFYDTLNITSDDFLTPIAFWQLCFMAWGRLAEEEKDLILLLFILSNFSSASDVS